MIANSHLLLENHVDAVLMLNEQGYIIYANKAAEEITGYSPTELEGKSFCLFYEDASDRVRMEYEIRRILKEGIYQIEGWRYRKDRSRFWAKVTIKPVFSSEENPPCFVMFIHDLTEKKQEILEIRLNEERYRKMVTCIKDYCMFMLDPEGYIVTWNDGARQLKGYFESEILGRHFSVFYTAEDLARKKPERELRIARETGKYEETGWRVKKDGSFFWARIVITALFNDQNVLIGFSKVSQDQTEVRQREEELRQSEERYRLLVEQVNDYGIFMMDDKGYVVSWNEGAKRINGYTASEIIGKHFSIFYPEEDILNEKPAYELKVARKTGKYEEEGWRLRKDGSRFWTNVLITAVYNSDHALVGFSKVTRDLTERKESEKALNESFDRVRKLVDKLKASNEELSYINEELEQFTSIVSHDLQEPIRTIKSFLQLIENNINNPDRERLKTYIGKSLHAANKMKELILNLLHYSQLSKGALEEAPCQVDTLFSHAIQNLKSSIDVSNAQIIVHSEIKTIFCDPVQIVQLIQNLLSNALKFTEGKNPLIELSCFEENGIARFAVKDNGIGIEKENIQKIFDIFRRLDTGKEYPGTGIGLAICKKIVDRHNGKIWIESEPGKGTTFYFTIKERAKEKVAIA